MEVIGIYFDVVQASQTPKGPFGLSIFVWGVILFTIASISIITQLWWHIYNTEHRVNSVIKELKAYKFTVNNNNLDAATVLIKLSRNLAAGSPE